MKKEMEEFERSFAELLKSSVLPMEAVLQYVGGVAGKRLRPRLVYQSARLFGEISEATRRTALFVELLHTATLIHDDVVDASDSRRGQMSVNAKWDSKTAVLVGDYLLSKAMLLLSNPEDHLILKEMLGVAMAMSEGELLQLGGENGEVRTERLEVRDKDVQNYLEIISRKTARLIRACCVGGALSVGASQEALDKVGNLGLNLGLVFQMRDDVLDHDTAETTALAERLLPEYLDRTMLSLEALAPMVKHAEVLEDFKELALFCAQRES